MTAEPAEQPSGPVYVHYPQGSVSGGPLALHQLVAELRHLGRESHLAPLPGSGHLEPAAAYESLACPIASEVPDVAGVTVIVPEVAIQVLDNYRHARRLVWWLSVDNATTHRTRLALRRGELFQAETWKALTDRVILQPRSFSRRHMRGLIRSSEHLAQSHYAQRMLASEYGIEAQLVSDYLDLTGAPRPDEVERRRDKVAYNPAKGKRHIERLRDRLPEIDWRPLTGLDRATLLRELSSSAIYLDLGHHPGRDRIPREAAAMGAVVVVLRAGSAAVHEDVPIPSAYKIPPGSGMLDNAESTLRHVLADLATHQDNQASYRSWIAADRRRFENEVSAALGPRAEAGPEPTS